MSYLFLEYPKCNTCRNAKKWLDEHKITYEDRHIIDRNPSVDQTQQASFEKLFQHQRTGL